MTIFKIYVTKLIENSIIESSTCEKLLGIKIDWKLCFDDHIQDLCNKANRKFRHENSGSSNSLHESSEKRSFNECLFQRTIQLLPVDLDAS